MIGIRSNSRWSKMRCNVRVLMGIEGADLNFSSFTMSKIPIEIFCKNREKGNGVQRLIDNKGNVIEEHLNPNGGISVDWISAEWLEKQGELSKNEKLTPKEGQHVHLFFYGR